MFIKSILRIRNSAMFIIENRSRMYFRKLKDKLTKDSGLIKGNAKEYIKLKTFINLWYKLTSDQQKTSLINHLL